MSVYIYIYTYKTSFQLIRRLGGLFFVRIAMIHVVAERLNAERRNGSQVCVRGLSL